MAQKNTIDELAAEMEAILNDDTYRSVFERPRIKMASAEEETAPEPEKNPIEVAYEQLVEASKILDELGLVKSAELTLSAVETLLLEAQAEEKEEEEEEEEEEEKTQDVKPGEAKPAKPSKPGQQKAEKMPTPAGGGGAKALS